MDHHEKVKDVQDDYRKLVDKSIVVGNNFITYTNKCDKYLTSPLNKSNDIQFYALVYVIMRSISYCPIKL